MIKLNLKYVASFSSRTRTMDLNLEAWLNIMYRLVPNVGSSKFSDEELTHFLQMILNDVKLTPAFMVIETTNGFIVPNKLLQILNFIIDEEVHLIKNSDLDQRALRRIKSHKPNVLLIQSDTMLTTEDVKAMQPFYL